MPPFSSISSPTCSMCIFGLLTALQWNSAYKVAWATVYWGVLFTSLAWCFLINNVELVEQVNWLGQKKWWSPNRRKGVKNGFWCSYRKWWWQVSCRKENACWEWLRFVLNPRSSKHEEKRRKCICLSSHFKERERSYVGRLPISWKGMCREWERNG